jgi:RNA polymerase sigma factor (sigma-70 family)
MASGDDDAALVAAARDGSNAALARLIDRHQQAVRVFLTRITGNREEAEDLAQETFVTACSQLAHYRGQSSIRTWLCAIAFRKAKSARRSWFRARARDTQYAERAEQERPSEIGTEESMALKAALASLSLEQRAAVVLCLSEDFSHAEAAEALSLPLGTVKSHVARGRAKLLSVLGGEP